MGTPAAVSTYHVHFRARAPERLEGTVVEQLARALDDLPSVRRLGDATADDDVLGATFAIGVASGKMSDAARDGGRLAKESLNWAGVDGQLIELSVRLDEG